MSNLKTYIALLRGINVSGQKKILMKDLSALFEGLGLKEVKTYIQSGNVVFKSVADNNLDVKIKSAIKKNYGWEVPTLVIASETIEQILNACPWQEQEQIKSYYCLMLIEPESEAVRVLEGFDFPGETVAYKTPCLYFYSQNGYGKAKMSNNFFERKLKVPITTRNHRTLTKLLELSKTIS